LAAVYALGGHHPLTARLIQAGVAGILHPWLSWRIGRRLFDERVGFAAAAIAALYGYFIYYAAALMTETFYILAILWALDLATRMSEPTAERPGRRPWIALGLALGAAALLRQVVLLLVPFLLLWAWWRTERLPQGARSIGAGRGALSAVAVMALLILPWTVRNYVAFERLVLLNTSAGYAFYWANHPIQGSSFTPILPDDGPSYAELIPPELAGLDEAALEQELLGRGIGFVAADPRRYVRLSLSRCKDYFKFWPSLHSSVASNLVRTLSFGVLLPFVLAGLWRSGRDFVSRLLGRRKYQGVPGRGLLCAFAAVYSLVHLLSWALVRYRLPVDAVLVIFAAAGVVATVDRLLAGRGGHEAGSSGISRVETAGARAWR
jgi:4-amino-4-deoxy-L-arabinose transferase-like glycosyltransferase